MSNTAADVLVNPVRIYHIVSPRKVGILPTAGVNDEPRFYFSSGDTFRVSKMWASPTDGRAVLSLTDGASWVSEFSRRDAGRRTVAPVDDVGALALRDELAAKAEAKPKTVGCNTSNNPTQGYPATTWCRACVPFHNLKGSYTSPEPS